MARPKKIGLEYFPVDVDFDDKVDAIEMLHGNNGLVWVIKFWQAAYKTENGEIDLRGLFGELHANKCRITMEEHERILKVALGVNFCFQLESGFYTSNGIKKRIEAVTKDRSSAKERQEERTKEEKKELKDKEKEKVKETPHYSENNSRITNKKENFVPPMLLDVESYFHCQGYTVEHAKRFFEYYQTADWHDGQGKKLKNWKQKAIAVWFKDEGKINQPQKQSTFNSSEDALERLYGKKK